MTDSMLTSAAGDVDKDPHRSIRFRYFRNRLESISAVIFLFHGRGGNAESIYEQLGQHLLRDGIVLIVPEASNNCWYPFRFNEPERVNQLWLDSAMNRIRSEVDSLVAQGLQASKLVFGGFSQGACLAVEYALRYPQRFGGVFCLSGGVIGPIGTREPLKTKGLRGTPMFVACADEDDWIPKQKFDESVSLLTKSGANIQSQIFAGLGHAICEDELKVINQMIDSVRTTKLPTQCA